MLLLQVCVAILMANTASALSDYTMMPPLPLGLWRSRQQAVHRELSAEKGHQHFFSTQGKDSDYVAHTLDIPINHFQEKERYHPHVNGTFKNRYWIDDSFYQPGGPVFVLLGGETSGRNRLEFLKDGILDILARATSGMSIVLEHRYYGASNVTEDLSTNSLRFLSTEQSLADADYFVRNVELPKLNAKIDLQTTPVIFYGGSYAGGQAAFMRSLYPESTYGAIASSGVVRAQLDSWQYFEPIRKNGPPECIATLLEATEYIDHVLMNGTSEAKQELKSQFGLEGITHDQDFVNALTEPLGAWQSLVWKKPYEDNTFMKMCHALHEGEESSDFQRYAGWIKQNVASQCPEGSSQDDCWGTFNSISLQADSLDETWRLWPWQFCTEWGYFMGGAPEGQPSLVSRLLDVPYNSQICRFAFDLQTMPNITEINQWGSFNISASRLAFIDGSHDPWIFATAHSPSAPLRQSTSERPYYLIPAGVHHSDEYGSPATEGEPDSIREVHAFEVDFVHEWLAEFDKREA